MTPAGIEWRHRMIALWSARAAELRATSDASAQRRALGLEWVVAGMQREIGAAAPVGAVVSPAPIKADGIEALRRRIAAIQPRFDALLGVTVNAGPIMDAVRARLQARLDGVAFVPASSPLDGTRTFSTHATIPAEVIPFIVGPQLGLFGDAL